MSDLLPAVAHPVTGEVLPLDAPTADLARALDELKELTSRIREVRERIDEELLQRMDLRGKWTAHLDGYTISAPSPQKPIEWNVEAVRATLAELVSEGLIDPDAVGDAVERVVSWKVKAGALKQLAKISEEVAARINSCGTQGTKNRSVSVKVTR